MLYRKWICGVYFLVYTPHIGDENPSLFIFSKPDLSKTFPKILSRIIQPTRLAFVLSIVTYPVIQKHIKILIGSKFRGISTFNTQNF